MWTSKRKLREENMNLKHRVAELEERLCPCEDHDWKHIGSYTISYTCGYDFDTMHQYKCRRCGKTKESMH
jgi:hypothetical protein